MMLRRNFLVNRLRLLLLNCVSSMIKIRCVCVWELKQSFSFVVSVFTVVLLGCFLLRCSRRVIRGLSCCLLNVLLCWGNLLPLLLRIVRRISELFRWWMLILIASSNWAIFCIHAVRLLRTLSVLQCGSRVQTNGLLRGPRM